MSVTDSGLRVERGQPAAARNLNVETIRVLAMVWLVVYHVVLLNHRPGLFTTLLRGAGRMGWIGTEIFLVIAGYYCVRLATRKPNDSGSDSLVVRVVRLLPPYALFLAVYLTAGVALQRMIGNDFRLDPRHLVHFFTFTTNIHLATGVHTGVALEGLFALSLGIQLYLCVTLLLRIVSSSARRIIVLLGMLVLAVALRAVFRDRTPWFIYFFTFTRMDAFVIGALLGVLHDIEPARRFLMKHKRGLLTAGAGVFVLAVGLTEGLNLWLSRSHQLVYPMVSLAAAALMSFAINSGAGRLARRVGALGRYSFSVYLIKLPLVYGVYRVFEMRLDGMDDVLFTVVLIITSILACYAVGALWFYFVDRPFVRLSQALGRRRPRVVRARA